MRLSQKLFVACVILAIFCVPSLAEDLINTSLVAFGQATLIVNVDGELSNALSDTFVPGNAAKITAPNVAGKTFNYWTNAEGRIISYNKELPLIIHSDTGLNAVYSTNTVTAVPVAEFLTVTKSASQILFNVIATVPSGTTITEYGIRYSTTKNTLEALKGTDGVIVEKAGNSDSNWLFFVPGSDDTTCYAVAYVISGGQTYYSNVITANLSALNSGLSFLPGAIYLPLGEEFDVEKTPDLRGLLKERVFNIAFDPNNGTGAMSPQGVRKNTPTTLNANKLKRDNYSFIGWNTKADGTGTSYQDSANVSLTGSMKLYAQWKANEYEISYDLNGGSVTIANPKSYDITTATFKLNNPTKEGYTFTGWTGTDLTGTSTDVRIPLGSAGNREYTAIWKTIEYSISYTLNNGSVSGNPASYTIESDAITLNNPTKNGYTFTGWTGTDLSGKTQTVTVAKGSTGDRSYTANFTPITYTISYELNGGTNNAENPTSYTIESATVTLKAPTRDGYNFGGWTFNGEAISEIAQGSTGNKTLTATWVETHGEIKPVISPASYALTVYKGQSSSLTLNATGTNLKWDMSGSLPIGMTFSSAANSATISGTPETGTSGSYSVTVTAANALGSASANVTITVANDPAKSVDVEAGTPVTTTTENGGSMTTTQTAFKNGTGQTILTADVSITTESEDFEAVAGNPFMTTIKVDVALNVADKNYNGYMYEMTLAGLPEWLIAEGELGSDDVLEAGETQYHHEFTLTGTPPTSKDTETLTLTAIVRVSGDIPTLEASGSKEVNISVSSPESARNSAVLQSMSVKVLGDDTLTTNAGASSSITFTANVQGTYSDGQTRILPAGSYALTWSANDTELASYGFSFAEGTLRVNANAPAGTHEIQITATAVSSDVSGTGIKAVTVTVQSVADVPTVPVLTCATINTTVKRGATIAPLTVRADTTPQEWLPSGELPEGLSYTADGNKFVISGTVSQTLEARAYVYTVRARNEAGTSEAITLTITVTATGTATSERVEVSAGEISAMTDEEIVATLGNKTDIALTGNVENLSETIARLETVTNVKTLDLSKVTGVSELKLEQTTLESITLAGNQSIKTVAVTGNTTLTTLNLAGSKVETVDAEGCEKLTSINLEGAENLTSLNVKETNITTLNVKDCAKLEMVDAKGCENLEEVNLEGCESLEYLDVSETAVMELNVQDCVNLGTIYCASCDLSDINLEGCNNLNDLDCSNNKLLFLDASKLRNLGSLKCSHQRAVKPLARLMNFLDLLLGRGRFAVSAAQENSTYLENVKNLKAYDEAGNELTVKLDSESGKVEFSGEPAKIAYDYDTGFENTMMDVEISASESEIEAIIGPGPSHGGCTFGFGIGALGILVLMLNLPRKKAE